MRSGPECGGSMTFKALRFGKRLRCGGQVALDVEGFRADEPFTIYPVVAEVVDIDERANPDAHLHQRLRRGRCRGTALLPRAALPATAATARSRESPDRPAPSACASCH